MANDNDKPNAYDMNALLFKIISCMSDVERRKLQAILMAKLSDVRNGKDLLSLISTISEAKKFELLGRLIWYHSKKSKQKEHSDFTELRGHPRKRLKIFVEVSKNGLTFMCITQNISNSGVFIETDFSFHMNQIVNMILSLPNIEKDIAVGGEIVRIDSKGIGVKFEYFIACFVRANNIRSIRV